MPLIPIDSIDDPRVEIYRNLKWTNRTRDLGMTIAESVRVVRLLVESDCETVSLLISDRKVDKFREWLPPGVPAYVIAHEQAEQLIGFDFHSGVLACALRPPSPTLEELLDLDGAVQTLIACPKMSDPENLGAVIRLATAFGADGMLLGPGTTDPFSRRALRVSMASALVLPIRLTEDLAGDLATLRDDHRFTLAGAVATPDAEPLAGVSRPSRLVLLLGHEADGLDDSLLALCHHTWTIPISDRVDSINVAVAAGIFLYELSRTRHADPAS